MKVIDKSRTEDVTAEEVKALETFKDLSVEQIEQLLVVIRSFTRIAYNIYSDEGRHSRTIELPIINHDKSEAA